MKYNERIHYAVCIQTPNIVRRETKKRLGRYPFNIIVRGFLVPEQPAKLSVHGRYEPYREPHFEDVCVSAEGPDDDHLMLSPEAKVVCGLEAIAALKEDRDITGYWSDDYAYT